MADNIYITKNMEQGTLNISDDVIAGIVRPAIMEIDGVADFASAAGPGIAEYIGKNSGFRGVRVSFEDDKIIVDVIITVRYGSNILEVAGKAQAAALSALEAATGFDNVTVNVHVAGVAF